MSNQQKVWTSKGAATQYFVDIWMGWRSLPSWALNKSAFISSNSIPTFHRETRKHFPALRNLFLINIYLILAVLNTDLNSLKREFKRHLPSSWHDVGGKQAASLQNQPTKTLGFNLIKPPHLGKLRAFNMIVIPFWLLTSASVSHVPSQIASVPNIFMFYFFTVSIAFGKWEKGCSGGGRRKENVAGPEGEISQKYSLLPFVY